MDIISTQSLFDSFKLKFSITANSLTRFTAAFLGAYNDTLMDLYNSGAISAPELLTSTADDSALTIDYLPIVKDGIRLFLQREGEWVKGDMVDQYAQLNWNNRIGEACNKVVTAAEAAGSYTGPWGDSV